MRLAGHSLAIFMLLASIIGGARASARVFNYKETGLAAYIRGTGGLSSVGQEAFIHSSGAQTNSVDGRSNYDYSGELGFMFGFGPDFHLRLGAELIQHRPVSEASGTDTSGTSLFTLNSSVTVFNPNVSFEYAFKTFGDSRFYFLGGVGLADVTIDNAYTMTSPGTSDYSVNDFTEKLSGSGISEHLGVGFETLFTDNVTISFDAGYRYLKVNKFKYKSDVKSILVPGGAKAGDQALNDDGSARQLDLGGLLLGVTFKFYLYFM